MKLSPFFTALFLSIQIASIAQVPKLTKNSKISLLTCATGNELYYAFGHSAFRVQDSMLGIDVVYNYGTFDFNRPNFYLNFAKGKTIYSLSRRTFERFLYEYQLEKRWVREQLLDLTLEEKNRFLVFLENNYLPENRDYLYDPLFNNCSSIAGDVLKAQFGEAILFDGSHLRSHYTFRQLVRQFLNVNSWAAFGIDLAFGSVVDRKATVHEHMFLPYYAMYQMRNTSKNGRPLLKKERTVLNYAEHEKTGFFILSPLFWFLLSLLLTATVTYLDHKKQVRSKWLDFSIFMLTGLVGTILLLLWFGTDHTSTPKNYNILWAMPFNLIISFIVVPRAKIPKWMPKYLWAVLSLLALVPILWIFKVQLFSPVLVPLFLALVVRYGYLIRFSKLHP